jgi:translation initiation factor 5B
MAKKKGKAVLESIYEIYGESSVEPKEVGEIGGDEKDESKDEAKDGGGVVRKMEIGTGREIRMERRSVGKTGVNEGTNGATEEEQREGEEYRSPICCILGHVDTGKTKILDKIRETDVQLAEAGGITQQIGATYIPISEMEKKYGLSSKVLPGLLVIDTPGHEAFSNLRSRGSSLCNIAVLVIDVMHGLEPQTRESIEILRNRRTPFVIALNKVDRVADEGELRERAKNTALELASMGINAALFQENPDLKSYVSMVPTSATTGRGLADLLGLLLTLVETKMKRRVKYKEEVECTVLEVRSEEGKAASIDVILSNGILREGDRIVLCSRDGAVESTIKNILTPQPMRETRVKGRYAMNKQVKAAVGVRIVASNLEGVLAGSRVVVPKSEEEARQAKMEVVEEIKGVMRSLVSGEGDEEGGVFGVTGEDGVHVQASTLGSLEALVGFLKGKGVPIRTVGVGTLTKKDLIRASSMREKRPEYALVLAFDIKTSQETLATAEELGVRILPADIIYHLEEMYKKHVEAYWERMAIELKDKVVFPAILRILPNCVFTKRSPLVLGVRVEEGVLRIGTPICVAHGESIMSMGRVASIQEDNKEKTKREKISAGEKAAIKLEIDPSGQHVIYKRHFDETDELVSRITRDSIDVLKRHFKDALSKKEWLALVKIKKILGVF